MATHLDNLFSKIPNVIGEIESKQFDSHDFIGKLIQLYPVEYIDTLYFEFHYSDGVRQLHAAIGRELLNYTGLVESVKIKIESINIHQNKSKVEYWRKK